MSSQWALGDQHVVVPANRQEVSSAPRSELHSEGTVGVRVNHALNLHVTRLQLKRTGS